MAHLKNILYMNGCTESTRMIQKHSIRIFNAQKTFGEGVPIRQAHIGANSQIK